MTKRSALITLLVAANCCLAKDAAELAGSGGSDWPHFLGPNYNASSKETKLLRNLPKEGPPMLWQFSKGNGHAAPAIREGRLVLFHRVGEREVVDCLNAKSGEPLWHFEYDAPFIDRFGASHGPHSNPVIDQERVFVFGITGIMHCLDLRAGSVLWKRDLATEYKIPPNFFGLGSTPLATRERVILNIGGENNLSCIALDPANGAELWRARHEWGASYASPIPATIHGRQCVVIFAGGESRPAAGGLLCIDAKSGAILSATPHRPSLVESVSASSPVVVDNQVFITESYGSGGALIEIAADFSATVRWKANRFGAYFMTPVAKDGLLFGFDGQHQRLAELVCYELASGRELWRDDLDGKFQRANLLAVDGAFLCLGENGNLAWLDLNAAGAKTHAIATLFRAPETWSLPALSKGLLYICQNAAGDGGTKPRIICYDMRAGGK